MSKHIGRFLILSQVIIVAGCNRNPYVPLPPLPIPSSLDAMSPQDIRESSKPVSASCSIDMIDQTFFKGHPIRLMDKDFVVSGWVLPETTHEVVKSAELRFTREDQTAGWQVEINHWISREDVLKAMKAEGAGDVGFAKYVDVSHLSSGNYRLSLAFASGGVNYTCDHHEMVALP